MIKKRNVGNPTRRRHRRLLSDPCAVCADSIQCYNFGAPSCQACTGFFRNSVRQKKIYKCRFQQQCYIEKGSRTSCRSCRFKKCMKVGMKKERVKKTKKSPQHFPNQEIVDFNQIRFLLRIEEILSKIRSSRTELSDEYIDQFASLKHLINSNENLLTRASEFSKLSPSPWEGEKAMELTEKFGFFVTRPKHRILDHLLCAGLIKSMPVTAALSSDDKTRFFHGIAIMICCFTSAYYSVQQRSDTVIKPNGLMPIWFFRVPRYAQDKKVTVFTERLYWHALKPFTQLGLDREEFVLLLAILLSHPCFATLSPSSQEQLYEECTKFSGILFRLLQRRHDTFSGVRRFVELFRLVGHAIWMANYYYKFATYMDVFHFKREREEAMPKAIYTIYSNK
uniref:Nuclear receptor domain-containing protein n=1 Tax=Globodera rostochiensis TaxID=31243 RepID=A0A914IC56_GLORO